MNMQQRKYLLKKRLEPLLAEVKSATRDSTLVFKRYASWGEMVQMLQTGELKLQRRFYHKSIHTGSLHTTYDHPFGQEGVDKLAYKTGGVATDDEARQREIAEWEQRFKHAEDFIMLASPETIIALLHNLEASVKKFIAGAIETRGLAYKKEKEYIDWLETNGDKHDYKKPKR